MDLVLEARCEVHSDPVSQSPCWGYRHDFATNAMCLSEDSLALVGGHGYKASLGWVTVLNSQRQSPPSTLAEHAAAAVAVLHGVIKVWIRTVLRDLLV